MYFAKNTIKNSHQDIDHSNIQPHFLYTRLWVIVFTFLCSNDHSWTLFFIYSGCVSKSCFSHCQLWYKLHWLVLTFRMYVELIIPDYILIWTLWLLSQWVRTMLCLHSNECDIFQQRVSCIINHDLCVVVTYCLFASCSSLDKPQCGTDFSQLCFEYGVSSLNHTYLHSWMLLPAVDHRIFI